MRKKYLRYLGFSCGIYEFDSKEEKALCVLEIKCLILK